MESTRSQREKRKSSGEADARGKRTRSESNENRPLLSKSSSAKIKEHGLPARKQQKRRKKKLLLSIAHYLKDNGFSESFEELLSNAKIKEDDLKKPVPDLEEIYGKHYFLTEEEPQDELGEDDPDAVNDTKAALLVPSIAEPNDDSQEHSQHDMADESLDIPIKEEHFLTEEPQAEPGDSDSAEDPIFSKFTLDLPPDDDSDFEGYIKPADLYISNVHPKATEDDIKKFFKGTRITSVKLRKKSSNENVDALAGIVTFESSTDTKKAIMKNGELMPLSGRRKQRKRKPYYLYVTHSRSNARTLFVSGFDTGLEKNEIREQLSDIFQPYSERIEIFLPEDNRFAYLYMVVEEEGMKRQLEKAIKLGFIQRGDVTISVREATMKKEFIKGWLSEKGEEEEEGQIGFDKKMKSRETHV